jgi:hypothetical protein
MWGVTESEYRGTAGAAFVISCGSLSTTTCMMHDNTVRGESEGEGEGEGEGQE